MDKVITNGKGKMAAYGKRLGADKCKQLAGPSESVRRVILGDSERQVAEKFGEAAKTYANDPIALHLRAMNMLYEGLKANSTIVIVPSTAVESMQLGGLAGMTALTMGLNQERAKKNGDGEPGQLERV